MKHFVLGGVTTVPTPFASDEDDIKRAQIKEIAAVRLWRNLSMPENFKISENLNRVIHSHSGGG